MTQGCEYLVWRTPLGPLPHSEPCSRDGDQCAVCCASQTLTPRARENAGQAYMGVSDWTLVRGAIVLHCTLCEKHQAKLERAGYLVVNVEVTRMRTELVKLGGIDEYI